MSIKGRSSHDHDTPPSRPEDQTPAQRYQNRLTLGLLLTGVFFLVIAAVIYKFKRWNKYIARIQRAELELQQMEAGSVKDGEMGGGVVTVDGIVYGPAPATPPPVYR